MQLFLAHHGGKSSLPRGPPLGGSGASCRALIVEALARLRASSCIIDGEAVACGDDGVSSFNLLRRRWRDDAVFLYAFDLIEFTGDDRRATRSNNGSSILVACSPRPVPDCGLMNGSTAASTRA